MFKSLLSAACLSLAATSLSAGESLPVMSVVKQASCGCCGAWVQRMQEAGFEVTVRNVDYDTLIATKEAAGLGEETWGCHTAMVDSYVVEGHVPAAEILAMLRERPEAIGLATPGMPTGSPGMEYGDERDPYDVLMVRADGSTEVFASYPAN
jgi:hypothetical protein